LTNHPNTTAATKFNFQTQLQKVMNLKLIILHRYCEAFFFRVGTFWYKVFFVSRHIFRLGIII